MTAISVTSPNATTRVYINSDGSTFTLSGGTPAWRNNNPGNLRYGTVAQQNGAIGQDPNGFAIFPDTSSGENALHSLITQTYATSTINSMMSVYAPSSENNTTAYQQFITSRLGVPGTTPISQLTSEQVTELQQIIGTYEGTRAGTITGTPTGAPASAASSPVSSNDTTNSDPINVTYSTDSATGVPVAKFTDATNGTSDGSVEAASNGSLIDDLRLLSSAGVLIFDQNGNFWLHSVSCGTRQPYRAAAAAKG
jgi:hypothetical protein